MPGSRPMHRPVLALSTAVLIACGLSAASAQSMSPQQKPAPAAEKGSNPSALVDGKLNVPGAPADSQTVPAKFSERNAGLDKLPMMALPLPLNDEQRRVIVDSVKQANAPEQSTAAKPADALPGDIAMHDLGESANSIPQVEGLKYVRTPDRVLLVRPEIRVVVGELESK